MSSEYGCVADLGSVRVAVTTDDPGLIGYLREFYPLTSDDSGAEWSVRARLAAPESGMKLTPWRVGYSADRTTRRAVIHSPNSRDLAVTTRKTVREALLDYCEQREYVMLHASAVTDGERVIVVVGDKGSGKTTLALNAALNSGYRMLSNDHLILYQDSGGLVVTSLPTPIPVKVGTYFDYADRLGQPWENEDVDLDAFRRIPRAQRYGHDRRLLYTYRGLGQPNPVHTPLTGRRITVVLASYASANEPVCSPTAVADPVRALWPHVRLDWVFDPGLNTRHLPRHERDRVAYSHNAQARLTELTETARVVSWRHHGELAPLLDNLVGGAR